MAKESIVVKDMEHCPICGKTNIEIHHIFFGTANRNLSDKYGLVVPLCPLHHRGNYGVHQRREVDLVIKQMGQRAFEETRTRDEFMKIFGRNYL